MRQSLAGYLPRRIIQDEPSKADQTREMQKSQILGFLEANPDIYLTAQEVADWGAKHTGELGRSMRHRGYASSLLNELNKEGRAAMVIEGHSAKYAPMELAVTDALKIPNMGNDLLNMSQYLNTRPDQIAGTHAYKFWTQFNG